MKKKIIMNNKENTLVEVDLRTQNVTPIKTGYKYGYVIINENKVQVVIELELPSDAKIVSSQSKNRTNICNVKKIYDPDTNNNYLEAYGKYITDFKYNVGANIVIDNFPNNNRVCCYGIHFCHSLQELEKW